MTTRLLPPDEWPKLAGTSAEGLPLDPAHHAVVVVEQDGAIVGTLLLLRLLHAECLWIAPAHRRKASVFRRLKAALWRYGRADGYRTVWASALSPEMQAVLGKLGSELPGEHYVMSIQGEQVCRPS
jgi:hypothetical protein